MSRGVAISSIDMSKLGPDSPLHDLAKPKAKRGRPEWDHERDVVIPFYESCGFVCHPTSVRNHPKGAASGMADIRVYALAETDDFSHAFSFWHETKIVGGKHYQTEAQYRFQRREESTGGLYVIGDIDDAIAFVRHLRLGGPDPRSERTFRIFTGSARPSRIILREMVMNWTESATYADQSARWGYPAHTSPADFLSRAGKRGR